VSPSTSMVPLAGRGGPASGRRTRTSRTEWAPWPVTPRLPAGASDSELARIESLARCLLEKEPGLARTDVFGPGVRSGAIPGAPCLHLHDIVGPSVVPEHPDIALEMRAFALAREGDSVLLSAPPSPSFLDYCRETLGLGSAQPVVPSAPPWGVSLAVRCLRDPAALATLAARARVAGGLTVAPYAGTSTAWSLAGALAELSGVRVAVCAPPPALTGRVNDKLWFTRVVEGVLGPRAEPPSCRLHSLAYLAVRVRELCRRFPRVAVKLPARAGALGNVVIDSSDLRERSSTEIRHLLARLLAARGWGNPGRLLLSAWECPVLVSPSVQIWVPRRPAAGPAPAPVVEGVFDQDILGPDGAFGGCRPTALPPARQRQIAHESALLARVFQRLGYVGRCSFDAILVGEDPESAALHWVECNGRWGGTSIPMTLADRLVGDWSRTPFVVLHRDDTGSPRRPFAAVLEELGPRLLRPGRPEGVVLVTSLGVEWGSSLDLLAFARTQEAAQKEADQAAAVMLGRAVSWRS